MGAYLPGRPACACPLDNLFMACKGLLQSLRATLAARSGKQYHTGAKFNSSAAITCMRYDIIRWHCT